MTLDELQSNEELRRTEFPIVREKIYLAHAGVCALPRRVQEAITQYVDGATKADQEFVLPKNWLSETRQLSARFLGVQPEEVAFVGSTSLGLSFVAEGLSFKRNQNVVIYHDDYPSNVYPWMALCERGVEVRYLNIREYGCIRSRDVIGQVDENTRLVALASCHFLAGYRIDLHEIGKFLRSRGISFCVDAIQTLGAFPTSLAYVDFAAADAHKWLLGPCAAGLMFVRREMQSQLRPTTHGWHNIRNPNFVAQDEIEYRRDARRYEAGSQNLIGLVGLRAALELLMEVGVEQIARDLVRKRSWLVPALQSKGYTVLNGTADHSSAGPMVTFFKPGWEMTPLHQHLEKNGIVTSLRSDRQNQQFIRLAPHFYNTDDELKRVIDLL
jgi:cysteine desulfurase / selenocysteine lyase